MCGATCLFWTTGIWCPGWPWLAVGTTAWCTTASCTRSADWAYRGTWTTWRGKSHAKHLCRGCRVRAWSARSVEGCWAVQFEQINIHMHSKTWQMVWHAVVRCSILQKGLDRFLSIFFLRVKRCKGVNLGRGILKWSQLWVVSRSSTRVCERRTSETICFLRSERHNASDSIHVGIGTLARLYLEVVLCGLFSWVFFYGKSSAWNQK